MRYAELLELAPELREFTSRIPEDLDGRFQLRTYPAHTFIHQKDSPLERIGILLRGTFRVVNEFENGNVFMIDQRGGVLHRGGNPAGGGGHHVCDHRVGDGLPGGLGDGGAF